MITGTAPHRRRLAAVMLMIITSSATAAHAAGPPCAPKFARDQPGVVVIDVCGGTDELGGITVTPSGHVVIAGTTRAGASTSLFVARMTPDGIPDTDFGEDGVIVDDQVGAGIAPSGVMVTDPGHVVVIGTARRVDAQTSGFVAVKYTDTGARDSSFGDNGLATARLEERHDDSSSGGTFGPNYTVVVGGVTRATPSSPREITAYRFENDGRPDPYFGEHGAAATRITESDGQVAGGLGVAGVDVAEDGTVVLAGTVSRGPNAPAQLVLVQYGPDGKPDPAFHQDGVLTSSAAGLPAEDVVIALQDDGSIVVAGKLGKQTAITRFSAVGDRDTSFNSTMTPVNLEGAGNAVSVANAKGAVLLLGTSRAKNQDHDDLVVLRFDGNGARDTDYAGSGLARTRLSGDRDIRPVGMALGADQSVVAGGATGVKGQSDVVVVRLDPLGHPEDTFGQEGSHRSG